MVGTIVGTIVSEVAGVAWSTAKDSALSDVVSRYHAHRTEKAKRAADLLLQQVYLESGSPVSAEGEPNRIRELLDSATPEASEAFFETIRMMIESVEPLAQVYLARLAAPYIVHGRMRDTFFRRVGRMLLDASAEEVDGLAHMFRAARSLIIAGGITKDRPGKISLRIQHGERAHEAVFIQDGNVTYSVSEPGDIRSAVERLKNATLAPEGSNSFSGGTVFVAYLDETRPLLDRLIEVFAGAAAA